MVERDFQSTQKPEDIWVGIACPNYGCKRVRKEREERPLQCTRTENAETTLYTSARPAERIEKNDSEGANAALRARFNQLQQRDLPRGNGSRCLGSASTCDRLSTQLEHLFFVGPVPKPIGLLYIDVRRGLRQWATASPYQDERSGRGIRMQYLRQSGTLRFSRWDADGEGANDPPYGIGGWGQ